MTTDRIQTIILQELMSSPSFGEKFLPYLAPEHFQDRAERIIFEEIRSYIKEYGEPPNAQAVAVGASNRSELQQETYEEVVVYLDEITEGDKSDRSVAWLQDQAVNFIRERNYHNSVLELVTDKKLSNRAIMSALEEIQKSLNFTLDDTPGLGLDWEPLFEFLQSPDEKFPFEVNKLNEMTCGGPSRKTVTVVVAPTNSGKSLILCHQAAEYLRQGRNVIYITLEMADKIVLKRIFANLLDSDMNVLEGWTKDQWAGAVEGLGGLGKLKVREYASRSAHAGNFRQYLAELKSKEKFVPDVIIVDYLNECRSQSMKFGQSVGSYQYFGSICSELRALATDLNAVVWTATQTNRDGYEGDPDLKNTSESAQINSGADLIIGVQKDDNLPDALLFRVLKNRDAEHKDRNFLVGVDRGKMRLFDVNDPVKVAEQMNAKRGEIQMRKSRKPPFA
jgi:replicative DNA helicase